MRYISAVDTAKKIMPKIILMSQYRTKFTQLFIPCSYFDDKASDEPLFEYECFKFSFEGTV